MIQLMMVKNERQEINNKKKSIWSKSQVNFSIEKRLGKYSIILKIYKNKNGLF